MASPVEAKRSFERVRKPIKVDQIDKPIAIVSVPLIGHSDTSSTPFLRNLLNVHDMLSLLEEIGHIVIDNSTTHQKLVFSLLNLTQMFLNPHSRN